MKKAAEFYLDILTVEEKGKLIICPGTSPENNFIMGFGSSATSKSTAMMNSIVLDLFEGCKKSCEVLSVKDDFYTEICDSIEKIKPLCIGKKGELLEWNEQLPEREVHHRHVSHLYALHPANLITYEKDKELFNACKKTLEIRGDDGTGWSLAWKINFWARLRDGDRALRLLDRLLTLVPSWSSEAENYHGGGGLYPNMFDAHPPFQIDGNFGAVSGICEMLMQSDGENVYLLPALPKKWKSGSVRGLAAPGNITVDIDWKDNKLVNYTIHGDSTKLHVVDCT
jgi:alpha-L-fucosidase 2